MGRRRRVGSAWCGWRLGVGGGLAWAVAWQEGDVRAEPAWLFHGAFAVPGNGNRAAFCRALAE